MTRVGATFIMCERCSMPVRVVVEAGPVTVRPEGEEATVTIVPLLDQHYCKVGPVGRIE